MDRKIFVEAIKKAKASEKKRNFIQSVDIVINLKEFDLKKPESKINTIVKLPNGRGREAKVCAFVGPELLDQAKKTCNEVILSDNFGSWNNPRKIKKLARNNDFFIAQANFMPEIAKLFGKYLAPLGKMPNVKAGQIVPPKTNIGPLVENLKNSVKIVIKKSPVIQCVLGSESLDDEQLTDNCIFIIDSLKSKLPKKDHNIASIIFKTTMGDPVKIEYGKK